MEIKREEYCEYYGPTVGDKIRLADTNLIIEIEKDFTVYGEEVVFGAGKNIRDGMGQTNTYYLNCPDLVITNVVIVDYWGIVKADIGIKDGYICGIGKAGNPDIMDGVTPGLEIGPFTEIISGEGLIATPGAIDVHTHLISPQIVWEALSNGVTTLIGGGVGPATGTNATNLTAGPWNIKHMILSLRDFPINIGLLGKGNTSNPQALVDQLKAGAMGFKIHEDWGATPSVIDTVLSVADEYDIPVALHTDTPNEAGYVENTIATFKGRTIHTYHSEGAGGGHAPDLLRVTGLPNVLPSSTTPTLPATINTVPEHLDMLMVCHHLKPEIPEDIAFAKSRIRAQTIAAESVLHDMGVISMISSDSQAMGRIGEIVVRTWQTAHFMKVTRGSLPEDVRNDNFRVKRYIAKYTINPAITNGISQYVGSLEKGKIADIVLWKPEFFGVKPEMVIKGGFIVWSVMGDANASIPTCEPIIYKPMFGSFGKAKESISIFFVSKIAYETEKIKELLGSFKNIKYVQHCRNIGKKDMKFNDFIGEVFVDPKTYEVFVNGEKIEGAFATSLPLSQKYFLF